MSEPYDVDYQKRIAKRLAAVPPYVPARPKREEWSCPNCGLNGDHMKVPISESRCKGCCTTDAANDLLNACRAARDVLFDVVLPAIPAPRGEDGEAFVARARAAYPLITEAIAAAEGRK